jgi:dihydroorotate dehydrogenase
MIYEKLFRPVLFRQDSERAHEHGVDAMALLAKLAPLRRALELYSRLDAGRFRPVKVFGLEFPNRVGLAAGFDKNARAWPAAAAMGFGHVEIGTVTALAQDGNPKPRMFRYPAEEAVINRMGFNNEGSAAVAARLAGQPGRGARTIPLGVNLGKSKVADIDRATEDYLASFARLADFADYLVLNVSSPNTAANRARSMRVPVLLKIAPDLTWAQVDAVLGVIDEFRLDGVIATNTTLARPGFFGSVNEAGGLSGAPVRRRSTQLVSYISKKTEGKLPIIGVGGITDVIGAAEKLDAGASLVQVYTGMIYRGPFFAAELAHGVSARDAR